MKILLIRKHMIVLFNQRMSPKNMELFSYRQGTRQTFTFPDYENGRHVAAIEE